MASLSTCRNLSLGAKDKLARAWTKGNGTFLPSSIVSYASTLILA